MNLLKLTLCNLSVVLLCDRYKKPIWFCIDYLTMEIMISNPVYYQIFLSLYESTAIPFDTTMDSYFCECQYNTAEKITHELRKAFSELG